jgi:putative nucleotidyltransferase with HDIG domain
MERLTFLFQRFTLYTAHFNQLVDRLIRVRQADATVRRRSELLNLSLLAMAGVVVLLWGFNLIRSLVIQRNTLNPVMGLVLLILVGFSYFLNRRLSLQLAANFFLVSLILVISLTIPAGALEPAYLLYVIPLILAGFVQPPPLVFFYALIAVMASAVMALLSSVSLQALVFPASVLFLIALVVWLGSSRWEKELQRIIHERQELNLAYDRALDGWSRSIELADRETPGHTRRVTELALALGHQMGLSEEEMFDLRRGAMLHDIGKMNVPEQILMKTGSLDEQESAIMQRHTVYAYEMLGDIPFLKPAADVALYHHESWDGNGYPTGLKGERIPRLARIFTVADVWDSLSTDRAYRLGWLKPQIKSYLLSEAGRHFDPMVVEALTHLPIWTS